MPYFRVIMQSGRAQNGKPTTNQYKNLIQKTIYLIQEHIQFFLRTLYFGPVDPPLSKPTNASMIGRADPKQKDLLNYLNMFLLHKIIKEKRGKIFCFALGVNQYFKSSLISKRKNNNFICIQLVELNLGGTIFDENKSGFHTSRKSRLISKGTRQIKTIVFFFVLGIASGPLLKEKKPPPPFLMLSLTHDG